MAGVVLPCGGESSRFGSDKTAAQLGGTTVLDHILGELPPTWPVVCVGTARPTVRPVQWTREDPPLGGPVAGIEAGLAVMEDDIVVVLAGDQPFGGRHAAPSVEMLIAQPEKVDGVVVNGQFLLGAYRREALVRVTTGRANASVRSTLGTLRVMAREVPAVEVLDVDTPADLDRARAQVG